MVEEVLRRDREGRVVHTNLADLRKEVEREGTSNRLALPLPDGVWLRYYRDHPDESLTPDHEHLRDAVEAMRQAPPQ